MEIDMKIILYLLIRPTKNVVVLFKVCRIKKNNKFEIYLHANMMRDVLE